MLECCLSRVLLLYQRRVERVQFELKLLEVAVVNVLNIQSKAVLVVCRVEVNLVAASVQF